MKKQYYQRAIIGAGAAGLYFASITPAEPGIILEKTLSPGQKLLLSGSGQCNLTHGGSIKEFIGHYGSNGSRIRSALYRGNNLLLMKFFTEKGLFLTERSDGKVFPKSMKAGHVLDLLLKTSRQNGWKLKTDCPVTEVCIQTDGTFLINGQFETPQLIVAAGGCSYPGTGSDGSLFSVLESLDLEICPLKPALVPLTVQQYPYSSLSGISFQNIPVQLDRHKLTGDLLLTHSSFSGPAVLNLSRYASPGSTLKISYLPCESQITVPSGENRQILNFLSEQLPLPKRFIAVLLQRSGIQPSAKACTLTGKQKKRLLALLTGDTFSVSGTSGFGSAMATKGGVSLDEVDLKTFESKKHPGLYIIGEALDIDGDTGGYNLQFAFSSAYCAARSLE